MTRTRTRAPAATALALALAVGLTACTQAPTPTVEPTPTVAVTPTVTVPAPAPTATTEPTAEVPLAEVPAEVVDEAKGLDPGSADRDLKVATEYTDGLKEIGVEVEADTGRRIVWVINAGEYNADNVKVRDFYAATGFWFEMRPCGPMQGASAKQALKAARECVASMDDPSVYEIVNLT